MSQARKLPPIEIGDVVWFYVDGDTSGPPCPAVVTGLGESTLNLSVIVRDAPSLSPYDSIRYIRDPALKNDSIRAAGIWDYRPGDARHPNQQAKAPEPKK